MKVLAINGSARKDGNTAIMVRGALQELEKAGIETELIQLSGKNLAGCRACYKCAENKDKRCTVTSDMVNEIIEKMLEADGIILASPAYFANVSTNLKALIERAGIVTRVNGFLLKRKVGAAVSVARRAGATDVFSSINYFFTISQMIVVGSDYWNLGFGKEIGEVEKDEEAALTMKTLGENMAWLLEKINA
jgi:multimeric flavodoxin WrbA